MTEERGAGSFVDVEDLLGILAAGMLLRLGFGLKVNATEPGNWVTISAVFVTYIVALACLAAGISGKADRYGETLALGATVAVAMGGIASEVYQPGSLGSDAILFSQYSADLLLQGVNPYAQSMKPAYELYPIKEHQVTPLLNGGFVDTLSYPALSVLAYVPQRALGIANSNLTTLVFFVATMLFLINAVPDGLELGAVGAMLATPNLFQFSIGGIFDIIWVFGLLVGMHFWAEGRDRPAAVAVGLAFAVKQTPWLMGPFLAAWIFLEADDVGAALRRSRTCIVWGLGAFLVPNLPFIVWDPAAWAISIDRATGIVSPPMVPDGAGLVLATTAGGLDWTKDTYVGFVIGAYVLGLWLYARHFDQLKWVAWVSPAFILWFNHRGLQNYFIFFVPVAFFAAILQLRDIDEDLQEVRHADSG